MQQRTGHYLIAMGLGMLVLLPCIRLWADEAPIAERPTPAVGNQVEFANGALTVPCKKWQITDLNKDGYMIAQCGEYSVYTSVENDFNTVRLTDKVGTILMEYLPYHPGMSFPLQVGKQWSGSYTGFTAANNARWKGQVACEVKAYEEVSVAAGTFKTFRVECIDNWKAGEFISGVNHTTSWYSPEVTIVVKTVTKEDPRWNNEVVRYQVK